METFKKRPSDMSGALGPPPPVSSREGGRRWGKLLEVSGMRKKNLYRTIMGNKIYQLITFAFLMAMLVVGYIFMGRQINRMLEVKEQIFSWVYQVDEIKQEDGELVLTGWAFELEKDAVGNNYEIVLRDTETRKLYFSKMIYEGRTDVNEYFQCEYNYTQSGFKVAFSIKKLDLENRIYEVMLRPKEERKAYSTSVYYANNQMMFVNPKEFEKLDVKGTDLEKIVENGFLRAYCAEYQTWVYQYEGELYWIIEGDRNFDAGEWFVQYQLETTQIERLPQHRLDAGYYWSNIGFNFSNREIVEWNTGKYRVAKCVIPKDHSVTKILTANYIDKWIWRCDFYPRYVFEK